jgi:hypothetical protein
VAAEKPSIYLPVKGALLVGITGRSQKVGIARFLQKRAAGAARA